MHRNIIQLIQGNRRGNSFRFSFSFSIIFVLLFLLLQACTYHTLDDPIQCDSNPVAIELISVQDTECGVSEGTIEVLASGGSSGYQYQLNSLEILPANTFSNLSAGVYLITAIDINSCSATIEVTVKNKNGLNISLQTQSAGCQTSSGVITVNAHDGVAPYQFKLNSGSYQSQNSFANVGSGQYTLAVKDAQGCEITQTLRVNSGVSFSSTISPIIKTNCAITGCHNGSQFPDFRLFKNIHDNASEIKTQTGSRSMPATGSLTQAEINSIACWVDDGAIEN
jgi:hypothetical protein